MKTPNRFAAATSQPGDPVPHRTRPHSIGTQEACSDPSAPSAPACATRDAYERYFALVALVIRGFRLPGPDVEEILQEVFLSFFRHCESIAPAKRKAWLCATARNKSLDRMRRLAVRNEVELGEEESKRTALSASRALALARQETIERALEGPAAKPLTLLHEHYFDGKPVGEMARARGLKVSTVTSALCRQRKLLARQIREAGDGET